MLKQILSLVAILVAMTFVNGCSQSDGYSTSVDKDVEVIHGYTLPPEPDPVLNNATILGIDSNNNGVRDDVEIWILKKFKDEHKVYTEVFMQAARATQKVLENPQNANEVMKYENAAVDCEVFYQLYAEKYGEKILMDGRYSITDEVFDKKLLNTLMRKEAYNNYLNLLSGKMYNTKSSGKLKEQCDFNTTAISEQLK